MKQIYLHFIVTINLALLPCILFCQAKLVINGGVVTISNGASLVVDNADNAAIVYNGTGYIDCGGVADQLIWTTGPGNAQVYTLPFGNAAGLFPLQFSAAGGTGAAGRLVFGTFRTPTWKNSDFLPPGVTNVNRAGFDNSAKVIDRFWQIKATGYTVKPTLSNLVFTYADAEYNAPNSIIEANLIPQRWNSSALTWSDYLPASAINTTNNTVTLLTVPGNQLYDWWTLVDASAALPVTLVRFTAAANLQTVVTNWQTAYENNSAYFKVWRSADGSNFESTGQVPAAGTSAGLLNYYFTDAAPLQGISYYRLQSADLDGKFTWSPVVTVTISSALFVSMFPNPASSSINLWVSAAIAAVKPTAFIYDSKGSLVQSTRIVNNRQQLNISLLPAGLYYIKIMYNEKPIIQTFIKN